MDTDPRGAPTDRELVAAARGGDRSAFGLLVERHRPLIVALCRRALADAALAEDATQEASLQAIVSLKRLRDPDRFGPWVAGIALNVCRRWLRERAREAWSWEAMQGGRWGPEPADTDPTPDEVAEAAEDAERVTRAVSTLPRGQRDAVMLFYVTGLTQQEVADLLGTSAGAIKTRLAKARLRLRFGLHWKEDRVEREEGKTWVEMRVSDVRRGPAEKEGERYVVLLEEVGGNRRLPIWVGPYEGTTIAMLLEQTELPRPGPYHFAASVLQGVGGRLREVRVSKLVDVTYYAEVVLEGPGGRATADARPSDALALSLLTDAPAKVEASLLQAPAEREGSWESFERNRDRYRDGAAEIAVATKRQREEELESFRRQGS